MSYEKNVASAKKKLLLAQVPGAVDSTYPVATLSLAEATGLAAYVRNLEELAQFEIETDPVTYRPDTPAEEIPVYVN